jgi:hypothetical protein
MTRIMDMNEADRDASSLNFATGDWASIGSAWARYSVVSYIPLIERKLQNIMYLGDSENDNPAFRNAAVSIVILSDIRLKPKLSCKHNIWFNNLPIFLKGLLEKDRSC